MKTRLHLTIEADILAKARSYATSHGTSISQMVEEFLVKLPAEGKKSRSMADILRDIKPLSERYEGKDLTKVFYEERKSKYGF